MKNEILDWLKMTGANSEVVEYYIRLTERYKLYQMFYFENMSISKIAESLAAKEALREDTK